MSTQIGVIELLLPHLVLSSWRLSAHTPPRSALPLAAVGIACLGLVPTFGGPDQPLHWAMTAAMVGVGALLWTRHRLSRREGPLRPVAEGEPRAAGKAVLAISGVSALLVLGIVLLQWHRGGPLGGLSLAMPVFGVLGLAAVGARTLRHRDPFPPSLAGGRGSRRNPPLDSVPGPAQRPSQPPTDGHMSA